MKEKRLVNSRVGRRGLMWRMMGSIKRLKRMGEIGHP